MLVEGYERRLENSGRLETEEHCNRYWTVIGHLWHRFDESHADSRRPTFRAE